MNQLCYSREMEEICKIQMELSPEDALQLLCDELLGENYYIADPVTSKQANAIIALEILKKYAPKKMKKKRW